jgi:hypothetical protein
MGTWGKGNFDDDTAADHLSIVAGRIYDEIVAAMNGDVVELEPDEYWGVAVPCNVELLALFAEQRWVGAKIPDLEMVAAWKAKYLGVWDAYIDKLSPNTDWKPKRRQVLVETFDRLAKMSAREADARGEMPRAAKAKKLKPKRSVKKRSGKSRR